MIKFLGSKEIPWYKINKRKVWDILLVVVFIVFFVLTVRQRFIDSEIKKNMVNMVRSYEITLKQVRTQQASQLLSHGKMQRKIAILEQELKNQSRYKKVTVTGYPPLKGYGAGDPYKTSSGEKVRLGRVAVCPDMFKQGWTHFRKIDLRGAGKYNGIYTINDKMAQESKFYGKCVNRIDIFQHTLKEAKQIFFENAEVVLLGEPS